MSTRDQFGWVWAAHLAHPEYTPLAFILVPDRWQPRLWELFSQKIFSMSTKAMNYNNEKIEYQYVKMWNDATAQDFDFSTTHNGCFAFLLHSTAIATHGFMLEDHI